MVGSPLFCCKSHIPSTPAVFYVSPPPPQILASNGSARPRMEVFKIPSLSPKDGISTSNSETRNSMPSGNFEKPRNKKP